MAVKGSAPEVGVIVPHLVVRDAESAADFYLRAFSARLLYRSKGPSGRGEHLHLKIWAALVQISSEEPGATRIDGLAIASPETLGGSTCVFQVGVPDVDGAYQRALDEGATSQLPPTEMFWGDRYALIRDPFGHTWALASVREILSADEIARRMQGEFGEISKT